MSKKGNIFVVLVILIGIGVLYFGYQKYQEIVVNKTNPNGQTEQKDDKEQKEAAYCFVGDKVPTIDKREYEDDDELVEYEELTGFINNVSNNCTCLSKNLSVLNNPIDEESKKSLQEFILKDKKFTSKDMKAFNEEYAPAIGYTKFVYNYTVCSARQDGDSCYVGTAVKVKDEWKEETQHMNPHEWSLEKIFIEKQIDKFCK